MLLFMHADFSILLTAIVFRSPGQRAPREFVSPSDRVCVGHAASVSSAEDARVGIDADPELSREHARLWRADDTWFIEDLGSEHGTTVDGRQIKDTGITEIRPGTPIRMGQTLWTFIPGDWIYLRTADLLVFGPSVRNINYALYHCRHPILGPLEVRNLGEHPSTAGRLTLTIGEGLLRIAGPCTIEIPSLQPGEHRSLPVPPVPLNGELLRSQIEPAWTHLTLQMDDSDGKHLATREQDIAILGFWSWPYERAAARTIAAFVSPGNPIVERIVKEAQKDFEERDDGRRSFAEMIHAGHLDAERTILKALYEHLEHKCRLRWRPPRSEGAFQMIRPAHLLFATEKPLLEGTGTCIDLAVLLSSCVERAELFPVILFLGDQSEIPHHAMAGCWVGQPGARPVLSSRKWLECQIREGHLLMVECTGCAENVFGGPGKQTFDEAVKSAREQLAAAHWVCGVDIGALRPATHRGHRPGLAPDAGITPMETAIEPAVVRAYEEAGQLARLRGRRAVETTSLFYGWIAANGADAEWLLARVGFRRTSLMDQLRASVAQEQNDGEPVPTETCSACWRLAREIAQRRGSVSIQERDLIWAILMKGTESEAFTSVCGRLGLCLDEMARLFDRQYPRPDLPVVFKSALPDDEGDAVAG